MRILVVEDEPGIAEIVRIALEEAKFTVVVAATGDEGLEQARTETFACLVLDWMLPGRDGVSICNALRGERATIPILMLTARDAVRDRIRGLEVGADDYLPKPFDPDELVARVRSLVRRERLQRSRQIAVGDLVLDTHFKRVARAGHEIALTPREYALLEALVGSVGRVLSRESLQERVWAGEMVYTNTVDAYIALLRKKIEGGGGPKLIHTVHGYGYTIREPEEGA